MNGRNKYKFEVLFPMQKPGHNIKQKLIAKQTFYTDKSLTGYQLSEMKMMWLKSIADLLPSQQEFEVGTHLTIRF